MQTGAWGNNIDNGLMLPRVTMPLCILQPRRRREGPGLVRPLSLSCISEPICSRGASQAHLLLGCLMRP